MTRLFALCESPLYPLKDQYLDSISVDCVILTFHDGELKVLLNKLKSSGKWMLPGGFVRIDESVDNAAKRVLDNRIGLEDIYLKQFHLFGECERSNKEDDTRIAEALNLSPELKSWYLRRFVTMGYYALVEYSKVKRQIINELEDVEWFPIDNLPLLHSDHRRIIEKAISSIRIQLGYIPIGYQLLAEKFTMPELRLVYEAILGKELDRRNFQRKMLSVGLILKLNEKRKNGSHKAPYLYSFNTEKYRKAEDAGVYLMSWSNGL